MNRVSHTFPNLDLFLGRHQDAVNKCLFRDQILGWLIDSDASKVTIVKS